MQQTGPTSSPVAETPADIPGEVTHVPLWVKGIAAAGAILFAVQMPGFAASLSDAIQKSRAEKAYGKGDFSQAIDRYKDLRGRYPADNNLVRHLGLSYYHAGRYVESIETFHLLAGVKMPKRDVEEINAAEADMADKLNLNTR